MELPGSNYLLTLATISITFVGLSTIAFVFRQALGTRLPEHEIQLIRSFIRTGFGITIFSLLPLLLGLLSITPSLAWRVSSLVLALAHINGLIWIFRGTQALRSVFVASWQLYLTLGISIAVILGLIINTVGIMIEPNVGLYALGATWILVEEMLTFILALRLFLEPLNKGE